MTGRIKVTWIDRGRVAQNPPDPAYPKGKDIDVTQGATPACTVPLACPAPRCGYYHLECLTCGLSVMVTTAGRPDDPRSVKLPCKAIQ